MSEPQPVFVDGPLRGQDYRVPRDCVKRGIFLYRWYDDDLLTWHDVSYRLKQYGIFMRVIYVWTMYDDDPAPGDLFDTLMSPAAKAAVAHVVA